MVAITCGLQSPWPGQLKAYNSPFQSHPSSSLILKNRLWHLPDTLRSAMDWCGYQTPQLLSRSLEFHFFTDLTQSVSHPDPNFLPRSPHFSSFILTPPLCCLLLCFLSCSSCLSKGSSAGLSSDAFYSALLSHHFIPSDADAVGICLWATLDDSVGCGDDSSL